MKAIRIREKGLASFPVAAPAVNRITFRSHIDVLTGYGQTAVALTREWVKLGYDVCIVPYKRWEAWGHNIPEDVRELCVGESPDEWELLMAPPAHPPTPGKSCVHHTMWEANRLSRAVVDEMNTKQAVIVPCEWCQVSFDASGIRVPIYRCPLAIETATFQPGNVAPPDMCIFGTGGRMSHGGLRKGIYEVYEAFRRAFPNETDVGLSIKVFPDCPLPAIEDRRVQIIREAYTDEQVADWYRALTCYVSCAAAEGFGLMPLQAMACGRPVITTQATGHAEYFDGRVGYPVGYNLKRAEQVAPGNGFYEGYWYMPDLDDVARQMRRVYEDQGEARRKGLLSAERAAGYTWGAMAERMVGLLREVGMLV